MPFQQWQPTSTTSTASTSTLTPTTVASTLASQQQRVSPTTTSSKTFCHLVDTSTHDHSSQHQSQGRRTKGFRESRCRQVPIPKYVFFSTELTFICNYIEYICHHHARIGSDILEMDGESFHLNVPYNFDKFMFLLSSILVPGSGEPNFDSRETDPFKNKKARTEGS